MTKIFWLTNPNKTLVESAWIAETDIGAVLNVRTRSGSHIEGCKTLRGAKQMFGKNYQEKGKWEMKAPQMERSGT